LLVVPRKLKNLLIGRGRHTNLADVCCHEP
jgi:hypothetical protein